jgi:hypothetical protein
MPVFNRQFSTRVETGKSACPDLSGVVNRTHSKTV